MQCSIGAQLHFFKIIFKLGLFHIVYSYSYLLLFRYDFVKGLNQKIEASLGRILDEELERESLHPNDSVLGQESAVTRIISKVRQTPEYDI